MRFGSFVAAPNPLVLPLDAPCHFFNKKFRPQGFRERGRASERGMVLFLRIAQ